MSKTKIRFRKVGDAARASAPASSTRLARAAKRDPLPRNNPHGGTSAAAIFARTSKLDRTSSFVIWLSLSTIFDIHLPFQAFPMKRTASTGGETARHDQALS